MGRASRLTGTALASALIFAPATAQDDEGSPGFLARQIESALSGPGREVRVRGFEGALSSQATLASLTFADADGVWMTLEDAVLDWNRAALLRGRLSVNALSAGRIAVARAPLPAPADGLPDAPEAEASGFALPELPVAVNVGALRVARLELGAPILGEDAAFRLNGSVQLEGGEAALGLSLSRIEGPEDRIGLDAAFSNASRELALDLTVREGPGGLASTLIGIPGAPSLALDIDGTGPLDDYTAIIDLSTQGQQRLAGEVTLRGTDAGSLRFAADVGGDITPVIAPRFSEFFGPEVGLQLRGERTEDGALTLEELEIFARSLDLTGSAALDADGQPIRFALTGALSDPETEILRLPVAADVTLGQASLIAGFDRAQGEAWTLDLAAERVDAPGLDLDALTLQGGGRIELGNATRVTAVLDYAARGIAFEDAGLTQATGPVVDGRADIEWQAGAPITLNALTLGGADYGAEVTGTALPADRTLRVDGTAQVNAEDLSRFSAVAGQDLTGRAAIRLAGRGDVLGGLFDFKLDVDGTGLGIGEDTADRFLEGPVTLNMAARRDLDGTYLDAFALDSTGVSATAEGTIGSGVSRLEFETTLKDVGLLNPAYEGALTIAGSAAEQSPGLFDVDVGLDGPYALTGTLAGLAGTGASQEETDIALDLALPDLAPLVPNVSGPVSVRGTAAARGPGLWDVDLAADAPEDVDLTVEGRIGGGTGNVALTARVPDVAAFVPGVPGAVALDGRAEEAEGGQWRIDVDARLPYAATAAVQGEAGPQDVRLSYSARVPDVGALVPEVSGALTATGTARQTGPGRYAINADVDAPYEARATATAALGGGPDGTGRVEADLDMSVPDLSPLVPTLTGALNATARLRQQDSGVFDVSLDAEGPFASTATAMATLGAGDDGTGRIAADVDVSVPDLSPLTPALRGGLDATARVRQQESGAFGIDLDAEGPFASTATAEGTVGGGDTNATAEIRLPDIGVLAPSYAGPVTANVTARQAPGAPIDLTLDAAAPYGITADLDGRIGQGQGDLDIDVRVPNLDVFALGISGGVAITGGATERPDGWAVDIQSQGPATANTAVSGTVSPDGTVAALRTTGEIPLELINGVLAPQRIEGPVRFDLALDGPPGLDALSGSVNVAGAQFQVPAINLGISDINVAGQLSGGTLALDGSARSTEGGGLSVTGPITLSGQFPAELAVAIDNLVLSDPSLYTTTLAGGISLTGPLRGTGATIGGEIDIGETELRIPSGGTGFAGQIPRVSHLAEPGDVFLTRERAGLINVAREARGGERGRTIYGLDLVIDAPRRIFLRGRGLDTELGGSFQIGGTTRAPAPVGAIEVIRGRLDLLGKRLELEQDGRVTLGGNLVPFLELLATSDDASDFTILIEISGPVNEPEFTFSSSPQLPEDEVLARFFFGKGLANLSPLQAAQLASSVAQLTGRGGGGILGGFREGLGVDDFNVVTDEDGEAALQVGQYLTDNIYTDVTSSTGGKTEVNINIDLTDSVTVKGSADNEGETSLGIFFERDY
ncbi:MAG: translocation/assembly module TamB domain-containing protein [Pseudomonadota bacterium]